MTGRRALFAALVVVAAALPARAQSTLTGFAEVIASQNEEESSTPGTEPRTTDYDLLTSRVNLSFTQPLFPNVRLLVGGFFESNSVDNASSSAGTDSKDRRLRPYARIRLSTPTLLGDLGWDRDDSRLESGGTESRFIRETTSATAAWYPDSRNNLQLFLTRNDFFDPSRTVRDEERSTAGLTGQYAPAKWLTLQYQGNWIKADDKLRLVESTTLTHSVRASLAHNFWRGRGSVLADVSSTWLNLESRASIAGTNDIRAFAVGGVSGLTDFPDRDTLAGNPALVDNDRTVSAGIDLGAPPLGGDETRRNLGVQFALATRVNLLMVWVDRPLRPEVASSFSWDVWTSDDNDVWTFAQTVGSAPFGPLDNRFEIEFAAVNARYVKLVTRPLDRTVPFADEFPTILVTEIDAFERVAVEPGVRKTRRDQQIGSFSTRLQLLPVTRLYYELNAIGSRAGDDSRQTTISNSLFFSKDLSRVWGVSSRVGRDDQDRSGDTSYATFYSAALTATPLPTFRATLGASGRHEGGDIGARKSDSVLATASATIYRGVDALASVGAARTTLGSGRKTESVDVTAGLQVTPNHWLSFFANYRDSSRTLSGGGAPDTEDPDRTVQVGLSLSPMPSLYLGGSITRQERIEFGRRTLHNYNVGWSPFPYGTLRFNLSYAESYESQFETLTRNWGPSLRWSLRPSSYIEIAYQESKLTSLVQQSLRRGLIATLRLGF